MNPFESLIADFAKMTGLPLAPAAAGTESARCMPGGLSASGLLP